jgi:hypothetical protein
LSLSELATPDLDLIKQVEQECRTATRSDFPVVAVDGTAVGVCGMVRQGRQGIVHAIQAFLLKSCAFLMREMPAC